MKKLKLLISCFFLLCLMAIFGKNVNAAQPAITYVDSNTFFKDFDHSFEQNAYDKDGNPVKHEIVLESKNTNDFVFYGNGKLDSFNNNYLPGYTVYIKPDERYNTHNTGDARYNYNKRFNGGESFTVRYKNVATYNDRAVDCLVNITIHKAPNTIEGNPRNSAVGELSVNYTEYGAIAFHNNFYKGLTLFDTGGSDITYNFVYSGTNTNIGKKEMYWSWGSTNSYEGISSANTTRAYYLVNGAQTTFTNFAGGNNGADKAARSLWENWNSTTSYMWGVGLDSQNCSDTWNVGDFEKTFISTKEYSSNGIFKFRTLSHDFWFCPFIGPIGATAPNPVKYVKEQNDSVWSDGIEVFVGDKIQYKVDQQVQDRRQGGNGYMKYSSFGFVDKLPKEVEYVSARVVDQDGNDITRQGSLSYDSSSHTVKFNFSSNYLANVMKYHGETYSLIIDCIVDSDSVEGQVFQNQPHTVINGVDLTNTPVNVIPHYKKVNITVNKEDVETGKITQGDATFKGAEYSIYLDSACTNLLETLVLDENGNATSKTYNVVDYKNNVYTYREDFYIKETKAPEGYLLDDTVYHVSVDKDEIVDVNANLVQIERIVKETVIRNSIEITKYLEQTDSTLKQNLAGAMFSATLISTINDEEPEVYYSTVTDENGYCIIENLPYGKYRVQEVQIPDTAYNGEFYVEDETVRKTTFDEYIQIDKTQREPYTYNLTDVAKKMQITIYKEDIETGTTTQGDATLAGAEYTIYRDEACTDAVETVTIAKNEANGTWLATSGWYLVGTYYVKETKAPEGYLIDENVYTVSQDPKEQTVERTSHTITSKELVMKGRVDIIKSLHSDDSTDSDPAEGCLLYLTLDSSNGKTVYEATIDENGHACFEDIPYGWYTITESEEAREAGYKLIDPVPLYIYENELNLYFITEENPIEYHVRVVKKDAETLKTIPVANTTYKIWSYEDNDYVTMMTYPQGEISEFKTSENGEFTTPEPLPIGKYKLVEITPPNGYHLNDLEFELEDAVFENDEEEPVVTQLQYDDPQKAKIRITKMAEVVTGVSQSTDPTTGLEIFTPVYEERGLKGVTYRVTAKENITTADGTIRMYKDQYVDITTDENGVASTDYLYLGEYTVKEISVPTGYKLNDSVEDVTLDYRTNGIDSEGKLIVLDDYTVDLNYKNERIPYELTFNKTFGESEFSNIGNDVKSRVKFGLYTNEDIKSYTTGNVIIKKDSLLQVVSVNDGKVIIDADIPVGNYYIKEIEVQNLPFEIDTNKYEFTFSPSSNVDKEIITINNGQAIDNPIKMGNLNLLKVTQKIYEANKEYIDKIVEENNVEEFNKFAQEYGLSGAKYQVYYKNNNGEYIPLQQKVVGTDEYEDIIFTTGQNGIDDIDLPYGTYYLKEIEAPQDHEIDPNYIEVNVTEKLNVAIVGDPKIQGKIIVIHKDIDTDEIIYDNEEYEDDIGEPYDTTDRLEEINDRYTEDFDIYELVEEKIPYNKEGVYKEEEQIIIYYYRRLVGDKLTIIKKDSETGKLLPGCTFTIKDAITGEVLVENAVTNEKGEYVIENVPYGRYVFTEIQAPEGYEIEEGSVGAVFDVKAKETIFEIVNTGDIALVATVCIALISILGITYVVIKNKKQKQI